MGNQREIFKKKKAPASWLGAIVRLIFEINRSNQTTPYRLRIASSVDLGKLMALQHWEIDA